jgi:hypothetical protein
VRTLGVSYLEARSMLVWEFNQRMLGKRDESLEDWRKLRWIGTLVLKPHLKKGVRLKPSDLLPLPDDIPLPRMSREEIEEDVRVKTEIFLKNRQN